MLLAKHDPYILTWYEANRAAGAAAQEWWRYLVAQYVCQDWIVGFQGAMHRY